MRILFTCLMLMGIVQYGYASGEAPVICGTWKLVKIFGGNTSINAQDIGKVVMFSKEGKCLSYMENFPRDAEYKLTKGFSYASGRNAWLMTFSNTIASNYEIMRSKDTLYLLCSCSEGRHFVFMPTKEKLTPVKPDTAKGKLITTKKVVTPVKQPVSKPTVTNTPKKREIPKYKPAQPAHIKRVVSKAKPKPHAVPAKKVKPDTTGL